MNWEFGARHVILLFSANQQVSLKNIFESFWGNFERTFDNFAQDNIFLLVAIDVFNAKSTNWYANDGTSFEGNKIKHVTSQCELLTQIINSFMTEAVII